MLRATTRWGKTSDFDFGRGEEVSSAGLSKPLTFPSMLPQDKLYEFWGDVGGVRIEDDVPRIISS